MRFPIRKIINDPVYGMVKIPDGIIFRVFEHPYFQRLRRIGQAGLTNLVYPGANHTRFHHALGAMHLAIEALDMLELRNVDISEDEATGLILAILLHDVGHGPFSHVLEHNLTGQHHEVLTLAIMNKMNMELEGALDTAVQIFTDKHPKKFLHQLISGQLDLDRMDYLNRDSFFTGVAEGKIGYDRIIKMITVVDNNLVIQEKGIYSVENFLMARRLMYWQVYLHKTVLAAEHMLIQCLRQARESVEKGEKFNISPHFLYFMQQKSFINEDEMLGHFLKLDDYDLWWAIKQFAESRDQSLAFLADAILNRKIFKIELSKTPYSDEKITELVQQVGNTFHLDEKHAAALVFHGSETNEMYNSKKDEIMVLMKDNSVRPFSEVSDYPVDKTEVVKFFLCYPKLS
ncbi:MAG TPA: HD domain-containing protein [Saprospiraceae bacterium]|jgi:HD superfamily phosphohydrolase|nr:MAG: metal dependent phosphohydrolase [Candidatus Parvibacillus calidus]MBX2936394.1 HD domain-containing protein [Saprospiraceae bacterium]MBK7739203.1 HD domain-containing protein [Candidatus Parvibacillus calidus]MCB0591918.1 HD domain-containing protein [Saprospiraceae bacterium]MCC7149273.1 HD domain-containing protein [Saprospiraceae bacterium]